MSKPKMKNYDEAYFDRWYRGKHASDDKALARKVAVAVAVVPAEGAESVTVGGVA